MYKPDELKKIISEKCKNARKTRNLTQAQVADELDIDWSHYGHIEQAVHLPSVTILYNLADILNFSLDIENEEKQKNKTINIAKTMINKLEERDLEIIIASLNKMLEK